MPIVESFGLESAFRTVKAQMRQELKKNKWAFAAQCLKYATVVPLIWDLSMATAFPMARAVPRKASEAVPIQVTLDPVQQQALDEVTRRGKAAIGQAVAWA